MNCRFNFKKVFSNKWYLFKLARVLSAYSFNVFGVTQDFFSLGYFWINSETFILKIIVPLWILKFATNLTNFSFSGNQLSTFPWWYATVIMLFIFMRRTSSYSLLMLAASLVLSNSSALLFRSSILLLSLLTSESINCCLTSSSLSRFLFLTFLEPFHH